MKQKILRFGWLIIAVMVLAFAPKTVQAQPTVTPEKPSSGDGSESNPYQIASKENLYWFANEVNSGNVSICAELTTHIKVNDNVLNEDGSLKSPIPTEELIQWIPIGNKNNKFQGTFDGHGNTISGLYCYGENDYVGLFGYIWDSKNIPTIRNVGVIDSYIKGNNCVGGVCGQNFGGIIENCYNTGKVSGNWYIGGVCGYNMKHTIKNCYNAGFVSGTEVGGVCGRNGYGCIIDNCYNTGVVSGTNNNVYVGGVCGENYYGTITNSYNTGQVSGFGINGAYIGGVCGESGGIVTNCYNIGEIGYDENNANVGGVCGYKFGGTITNCYYLNDENKSQYPGIGKTNSSTEDIVEGKSADEFANGSVAWLLNGSRAEGTDENPLAWYQKLGNDGNKYPVLLPKDENTVYASHLHCDGKTPYEGTDVLTNTKPETVTIDEHDYNNTLSENPDAEYTNLHSYICDYCKAAEPGHKSIKNLTKDDDADIEIVRDDENAPWKTTSAIDLTDAAYYNAPVEFTTTGGVTFNFTRTADVKWATLCLPYKITTSDYTDKCKLYKLNSVGENEIVLGELSGEIAAGTPVFVKSENGFNVDFSIPANTEIEMTTAHQDQSATDGTLIGTFEEKTLTEDDNANDLFIKENLMWSVSQAQRTMKVKPFRAYIVPATSSGAPQRSITIDGEATAISDALDTLNDANAEYYDMNGRRINALQKGVNIIRSGNKTRKVIIK